MIPESELQILRKNCINKDGKHLLCYGVNMIDLIDEALAGRRLHSRLRHHMARKNADDAVEESVWEWEKSVGPLPVVKPPQHEWVGGSEERGRQERFDRDRSDLEKRMLTAVERECAKISQGGPPRSPREVQLGATDWMIYLQGGFTKDFRGLQVTHDPARNNIGVISR